MVDRAKQARTVHVVQSSRVNVTDAQAGAVGRLGVGVVTVMPGSSSEKADCALVKGALERGPNQW